jgi:lipopolysaccharide/colanic/teichoic acid biosynthesis glycosyltransferase
MNPLGILVVGLVLSVLRFLAGLLLGQQVKGSIPDYTAARARAAAGRLPQGLAVKYEEEWLATLEALADKPISAIKYAHGLRTAANSISVERSFTAEPDIRRKLARATDAVLGLLAILLLAPLVGVLTIAVGISGGPRVLSRTPAFGLHGKKIYLLSFRLRDRDDRGFTAIGRWMYRTGLAELPVLVNVVRGEVAFIGPPALRPIGVKMNRPRSPVRPGLISWQRMARVGYIDIGISEARDRDERRSLRRDLALAIRWPAFVGSAAEMDYYEESHCNCGTFLDAPESAHHPNSSA